jgi:hypothetical protein
MHAELVCRGWQPREGSFVMDAPPHDDVEELKRLAGCPLRGDIADVGVKRAAQRERMMLEWIVADKELKPEWRLLLPTPTPVSRWPRFVAVSA